mmetsp:Transcript_154260/g.474057  ORF Transcript_154260/g.474057 Transcript_154260/m.474057 type:complete len:200 (-) Transcript_154260:191-790(-)
MNPDPLVLPEPSHAGHQLGSEPIGNVYSNLKFEMPSKIFAQRFFLCLPAKALSASEKAAEASPPTPTMLKPRVSFQPKHTWAETPTPTSAVTLRVIGVHWAVLHFPASAASSLSVLMPMDFAMSASRSARLLKKLLAASRASRKPGVSKRMLPCSSCSDMPVASTDIAASACAESFSPSRTSWRPASAVKLPSWTPKRH